MMRLSIATLLLSACLCNAFVVGPPRPAASRLFSAEQQGEPQQQQQQQEASAAPQEPFSPDPQEPVSTEAEGENAVQEEEVKEDPHLTALKQQIADLESSLKAKETEMQYQTEKLEEYSQSGYARKVAEMETMRRRRSLMNSSSREAAMASVLQNFLPILDELEALQQQYGQDEFGKGYNALAGAFRTALKELGAEEYTVDVGSVVDPNRVTVVQEEYSDEFPKGTVLRPVSVGVELQGNVMRMAECVASLGSEAAANAPKEQALEQEGESHGDGAGVVGE